ncbi:MAG: hypothetical protein KatS3mg043_1807 [Rhodothermaceae bacterium]|nr:MAG: hypothetical protein KatS3mg043_1807 [Rhodothermaceae bacterium]
MHRPSPLDRDFFARSTVEVARALVGCRLVYEHADGVRRAGTIVETEAYPADDPAWRSWGVFDPVAERVRPEGRALDFFGRPGTAYLYRIHVYWLLNVVTEPEGVAGGVLIRAVAPEEGGACHVGASPGGPA